MNPSFVRLHFSSSEFVPEPAPAPGEEEADVSVLAKSLTAPAPAASKLCDPTLEKSHLHESQVTINCQNGQLKEYRPGWLGKSAHRELPGTHTQRNKMAHNSGKPTIFLLNLAVRMP